MASKPIPQTPPDYLALDRAAFRRAFLSRFDTRDRAALHELGRLLAGYVTERSPSYRAKRQGERPIVSDLRPWRLQLSARAVDALQVARTIADLNGGGAIQPVHLAEAVQYTTYGRVT